MHPSDMFVLDATGNVKEAPAARPAPYKAPKLTECAPLFQSVSATLTIAADPRRKAERRWRRLQLYGQRRPTDAIASAGVMLHSHYTNMLATMQHSAYYHSRSSSVICQAFDLRGAGAVLHSHSTNAVLATMLEEGATEFHVTQLEMIKVTTVHQADCCCYMEWD